MIKSNIYSNEITDLAMSKFGYIDDNEHIYNVEFYFTDSGVFKVKITVEDIKT